MAPRVTFYNVAPDAQDPLLIRLIEAAWRRGRSMVIHCADRPAAEAIDAHLWTYEPASFLPHELNDGQSPPDDPEARVLITWSVITPPQTDILVQQAPAPIAYGQGFAAVVELVDKRSEAALNESRARYKAWRALGVTPDMRTG